MVLPGILWEIVQEEGFLVLLRIYYSSPGRDVTTYGFLIKAVEIDTIMVLWRDNGIETVGHL